MHVGIVEKTTAALILGAAFLGGTSAEGVVDSKTTFAKDALQKFVDSGEMPGAVCVFYRDGVQETTCLGYADVATKRPITIDDLFMQCSQTKGFCGVTVALLVEEGKIGLDDPVSKYLPEFATLSVKSATTNGAYSVAPAKQVLTIRQVMNHTGGLDFDLPNYKEMGGWVRRAPIRSVAAIAASIPLMFEPGTRVAYSNIGLDVGAAVVETVTGQRWEDFLKARVLDPLGMKDTTFRPTEAQLRTRMMLYQISAKEKPALLDDHPSMRKPFGDDRVFASAGAGLWTTVRDQLKFYKMLMNLGLGENGVRILKEDTVKNLLAKSSRPRGVRSIWTDAVEDFYSLGLYAPAVDGENQTFGHGGAWWTSCSVNWHKKELELWACQMTGEPQPWDAVRRMTAGKFFNHVTDDTAAKAHTGRVK